MPPIAPKKEKKKLWSSQEESVFCEVWAAKIDMLRGARKNSHILKEMCLELEAMGGIVVTADEIKSKLHNMTTKYKKEKDKVGASGGSPSSWELYSKVHSILGSLKMHNLKDVVEESITDNSVSYSDLEVLVTDSQLVDFDDFPSTSQGYSDTSSSAILTSSTPRNTKNKRNRDDLVQKLLNKFEMLEDKEEKERLEQVKWEKKIYNLEVEKKKF